MKEEEIKEQGDLFEHFRFVVDKGQAQTRIDKFINNRIENVSRTKVQKTAEAGNILVNNKPVKSNYNIKPGDVISVDMTSRTRRNIMINQIFRINMGLYATPFSN